MYFRQFPLYLSLMTKDSSLCAEIVCGIYFGSIVFQNTYSYLVCPPNGGQRAACRATYLVDMHGDNMCVVHDRSRPAVAIVGVNKKGIPWICMST